MHDYIMSSAGNGPAFSDLCSVTQEKSVPAPRQEVAAITHPVSERRECQPALNASTYWENSQWG